MQRWLIILGAFLLVAGLLWPYLRALPLGRLPGDILIERERFTVYLPVATCVVVSVLLTLLLRWFR
jgi:hypothetical protein